MSLLTTVSRSLRLNVAKQCHRYTHRRPSSSFRSTEVPLLRQFPSTRSSCPSGIRTLASRLLLRGPLFRVGVSVGRHVEIVNGCSCADRCQLQSVRFFHQEQPVVSERKVAMPEKDFERLPGAVVPKQYELVLTPDLVLFTFQGKCSVQIEVIKETDKIVLNALELQISNVKLEGKSGSQSPEKIDISAENETAEFTFSNAIVPATYTLHTEFTGEINDKMRGLYRSKYVSQSGDEKYAAVTQFEATDARRCFPCWDEPALKATFDISLIVPQKLEALSNMPVRKSSPAGDLVRYDFETTPIMSTYLVAAVVGEYDYVEDKSSDGVVVRVYTPRGKKDQGRFALEVATKVLPYYKEYFNIAYPLPKIDLITVADFSAGAMENWGLVTYRETCLLVDPQNTSTARKQWIAVIVGHELAHQWFGNLVTMEWWTHLWLNEGYASFVEFLCVDHLFPHYDIWTQFVNDIYIRALELDCLKNSHPIEVPVGHPSEIDEIFDDISYNKGASVIRMLHHYIGDDDFRKGMNIYLTRHQYKNTFTEDLWAALEEASKKPVGKLMSTWTKQMGFPVIKVVSKPSPDGNGLVLTVTQNKYCGDGSPPPEGYQWLVPITIATSKNPRQKVVSTVLSAKQADIIVPDVGPKDWIKVNPGTVGYYRTQYDSDLLERLIPAVKDKSLPPLDRLGLLDDLFAMVQAGKTSTVEVLKLLQAYEDETDYTVWSSISNILTRLGVLLSHTESEEAFMRFEKKLLQKVSQRLGWDSLPGEVHLDTLLRGLVLGRLAWLDDEEMAKEAKTRFNKHIGSGPNLDADLRSACYKAVLRAGNQETFDTMLKLYRSADLHEEKDRISRALGAAKDKDLLAKVLEFSMSDEVRSQDTVFVITSVAMTKPGRELAWQFFKDNFKTLIDRYMGGFLLTRLVKYSTENFASEEKALEVEKFFIEQKCPGAERTVQQSLETIRLNAAWLSRDAEAIRSYLK